MALAVAELLRERGEDPVAVSADALQVYTGLETLTGAPSPAERERLEHRLVGVLPVSATFSAGEYAERAHEEIDAALAAGRRPIVVGGTGLYLQAALTDLELRPPPPRGAEGEPSRRGWTEEGRQALHAELAERAPDGGGRDPFRRPDPPGARARAARDGGGAGADGARTRGCGPRGCVTRRCCAA